ncbi:flagellar protein FlaG [Peribacillus acanthi]|uniref:flagellar protein FlaG n=1 Tax=Peribacillus acanthi TaxID=2171554 RepID=UPI000D3E3A4B|nr:flagellar protein FlaG [Peribacillus acanthi]
MMDRVSTTGSSSVYRPIQQEKVIQETPILENKKEVVNEKAPSKDKVEEIISSMNKFLQPTHTSLKFEFHEKLNEYYVKLIDDKTQEVVREIPSKKLLDMHAAMTEFIGLMVDKKI